MECVMLARIDEPRATPENLVGVYAKLDSDAGLVEAIAYALSGRVSHVFCGASTLSSEERYAQVRQRLVKVGQVCQWRGVTPVLVGHLWPADGRVSDLLFDVSHYASRLEALGAWAKDQDGLAPGWQTALDIEAYGQARTTVPASWAPRDSCRLAQVIGGLSVSRPHYIWPAGSYVTDSRWMEILAMLATTGRVTEHTLRRSQYATWLEGPPYPAEVAMYSIMADDANHWTWADFLAQGGPRIALPLEGANQPIEKLRLAVEVYHDG